MKKIIVIFWVFLALIELDGQQSAENLIGKVSFISSQNIYVKFKSTSGISVGDTLFLTSGDKLIPALIVNNLSSVSCLCNSITDQNIPVDHIIIARARSFTTNDRPGEKIIVKEGVPEQEYIKDSVKQQSGRPIRSQFIRGSISVNSYSDFSNTEVPGSQRFRYTFALNAANISGSKFSLDSYVSFRHKSGEWQEVKDDIFSALKIYNLSLRYDLNKSTSFSFGRRINPRISSMGAIDGIQFEKSINKFSFGILAGSRPDYQNYSVDLSLFQYGGYLAFSTVNKGKNSESSLAYIEQTNNFKTDRRFLYFQHSNTFIKNLWFLSTVELDLFKLENEVPSTALDLTGTYISLSYRITKKLSVSGSYDARKNVMYYETYKSYVDRLLENELRQGFRLYGRWRFSDYMIIGLQSGYRFLKSDPHPSKNVYGYFTYTRVPGLNLSATISGSYLESSFVNSKIAGLTLLKDFPGGRIQTGIGYHFVDNTLSESQVDMIQHIGELNLYWLFSKKMSLSANYEGTFETDKSYNRIYLQLRTRF
jgi:hypothetical protein